MKKHGFVWKCLSAARYLIICAENYRHITFLPLGLIGRQPRIYLDNRHTSIKGKLKCFGYNEIHSTGQLRIGQNLSINHFSRIICLDEITIGDNVNIAEHVAILDHDHNYQLVDNDFQLNGYITAPIKIGNNVWIADKCTVLKGVEIGNNVIIGANSVVTKSLPSNCIAVGAPAKVIKKLTNQKDENR